MPCSFVCALSSHCKRIGLHFLRHILFSPEVTRKRSQHSSFTCVISSAFHLRYLLSFACREGVQYLPPPLAVCGLIM